MANSDPNNLNGDILSYLQTLGSEMASGRQSETILLQSIDKSLKEILKNGAGMSQSNAINNIAGYSRQDYGTHFRDRQSGKSGTRVNTSRLTNGILEGVQSAIIDSIRTTKLSSGLTDVFEGLSKQIGASVSDIPKALGKSLGKSLISKVGSKIGSELQGIDFNPLKNSIETVKTQLLASYGDGRDDYYQNHRKPTPLHRGKDGLKTESQSNAKDKKSPGDSSSLTESLSVRSMIVQAQSVVIQDMSKLPDPNPPKNDPDDTQDDADKRDSGGKSAEDIVKEYLKTQYGDNVPDFFKDEQISQIANLLMDGGGTADMRDLLKHFMDDENSNLDESLRQLFDTKGLDLKSFSSDLVNQLGAGSGAGGVLAGIKGVFENLPDFGEVFKNVKTLLPDLGKVSLSTATDLFKSGAATIQPMLGSLGGAIAPLAPALIGVTAAFIVLNGIIDRLGPAIEGTKKLFNQLKVSADRYNQSQIKNLEYAKDRLAADVKTMVEEPFNILKSAAQSLYDAWDQNLRTINATQGYSKDDLQSLIGSFADRLRDEGLTKVISTSDITNQLTKVLEAGLSGTVAEEFAYLATKLNAAIPTQDFFGYASTYASIAANAIQQGQSEAKAIAYANEQLESFANNLLYASREVAGGFTTGLKDASNIFTQSVQIAQASKEWNASEISGVMTAVSAIVGAVAPDLANGITDAIYKAAVGGNSSDIVALRSLAGINASNTEFLKQLATDPQGVFGDLFTNLASMQSMADDAYMEVAEGLSKVFGVSMDAFARVDFNYLAQAIVGMNTSSNALSSNIALLASGETTTNAEQLKMQQINEYMLEEGLAYVLDNEAARSIQEHMWDEQMARELMEATYGVELQGAALEFLEGIRHTVDNIIGFLNPLHLIGKVTNLVGTITEASAQEADIKQLLELGKIGAGNAEALYQLTTRNQDLNVTDSLVDLLGGRSKYESASDTRNNLYSLFTPWSWSDSNSPVHQSLQYSLYGNRQLLENLEDQFAIGFGRNSAYRWGTVGKSSLLDINGASVGTAASIGISDLQANATATAKAQEQATGNISKMLESMSTYFSEVGAEKANYTEWVGTASKYGISDFSKALESVGLSEASVRGQFDAYSTESAARHAQERQLSEEKFWENSINEHSITNKLLEDMLTKWDEFKITWDSFVKEWSNYFVEHTVYNSAYTSTSVDAIRQQEAKSSEDAIYALANALTQNSTDLLVDPTIQTNALMAQLLKVATAILTQVSTPGVSASIPNTLSAQAISGLMK